MPFIAAVVKRFGPIRRKAAKCKEEAWLGAKIAMLIPASVATNWFADMIHGIAMVLPWRWKP